MKVYKLDFSNVDSREGLMALLAAGLELPEYFGENLDALSDCLTEFSNDVIIILRGTDDLAEKLGRYGEKALSIFRNESLGSRSFVLAEEE